MMSSHFQSSEQKAPSPVLLQFNKNMKIVNILLLLYFCADWSVFWMLPLFASFGIFELKSPESVSLLQLYMHIFGRSAQNVCSCQYYHQNKSNKILNQSNLGQFLFDLRSSLFFDVLRFDGRAV